MATDWILDDERFRAELLRGFRWERFVAYFLTMHGLRVEVGRQEVRPHHNDRHRYSDRGDLLVEGRRVEVKARRFAFTHPGDVPYPDIILATVEARAHWVRNPPEAVVCVSEITGGMIAIGPAEIARAGEWREASGHDSRTNRPNAWTYVPRSRFVTIDRMIQHFKGVR